MFFIAEKKKKMNREWVFFKKKELKSFLNPANILAILIKS
jgi:hypothetical protein